MKRKNRGDLEGNIIEIALAEHKASRSLPVIFNSYRISFLK